MTHREFERSVQKKEAYAIYGISRATFDRWRKKPGFPRNLNPGGRCLFWLPDLMGWLQSR
jgi:predicted DNA-binding transcriptional regulator AlpA